MSYVLTTISTSFIFKISEKILVSFKKPTTVAHWMLTLGFAETQEAGTLTQDPHERRETWFGKSLFQTPLLTPVEEHHRLDDAKVAPWARPCTRPLQHFFAGLQEVKTMQ